MIGTSLRGTSRRGRIAKLFIAAAWVIVAIAPAVLVEQGKAKSKKKEESAYAPLFKVPQKDAERQNPLENDPDAVGGGANLFDQHCAECHGEMAEGTRKAPSLRADEVQQAAPGTLFWILTNGVVRHGMPVWSKLPEPQRWQLVSYVKSLSSAQK